MKYDVVIIGGGLGGLSAGLKLSNEGKKVAILEKHHLIGGYSTNFRRKDKEGNFYNFDVALHGIGGIRKENAFNIHLGENLGILDDIEFLEKPETATIITKNGEENDIPSNFEDYKNYFIKRFEGEKENIERLFDFLFAVKEDMKEVARDSKRMPKYTNYLQSITLDEFLREYTQNDDLIEEFSFLWLYYGLPQKELNASFYVLPWLSYHIGGTYYVRGGGGNLSEIFANKIKENGSDIFLSSEVVDVEVENDKIVCVKTKKDKIFMADKFVLACDPKVIFPMIKNKNENIQNYVDKMNSFENSISLTQLYLGLDVNSKDLGMTKGDYFIKVSGNQNTYEAIKNGDYENMDFGITCYDVLDPEFNDEGKGVITIIVGDLISNWPEYKTEEYKERKKEISDILIAKAEKVFPNIKEHIKVIELGTPHTMKRYTNNSEGAVYGWAQNDTQGGFDRLAFKTCLKNTYLAGAWTHPGGGFEGAITSGVICGEKVLREKEEKNEEKPKKEITMDLSTFMLGMASNLNKEVAKGEDLVYCFDFEGYEKYYMAIKNQKAKVSKTKPEKLDVTVKTTYQTWYEIAFEGKDGADAFLDGKVKIEGSPEAFMKLQTLFDTSSPQKKEKKQRRLNSIVGVNLALLPWILYWVLENTLNPVAISLLATLSTVTFVNIIKPKKELDLLETVSLVVFSAYGALSVINVELFEKVSLYLVDFSLIFAFLFSVLINKPITGDYAKLEYSKEVSDTKLFLEMNMFLSGMWAIIFSLNFLVKVVLPSPINNVAYLLIIVGLVMSYVYPKKRLTL